MGTAKLSGHRWARAIFAFVLAFTALFAPATVPVASANGGDRTLYLYHTHTKQTGRFTFRKNGKYDQKVLRDLNVFLADWRTKEPTKMDPALFDLIWSVYQEVRGTQPVHIVSSYRSPKTNAMLASKSSGVADNSQHMKGKAIDFFIPGVDLSRLRAVAMKHQVGGVGYYPTSGSPFVHLDTGSVRAWPRMTTAQLKKVFPDGRTMHVPADGKVLSQKGYQYAQAEWSKCRMVPCNGAPDMSSFAVAEADAAPDRAPVPAQRASAPAAIAVVEEAEASLFNGPTQRSVATIAVAAPVPAAPPSRAAVVVADASLEAPSFDAGLAAPVPAVKSQRLLLATGPSVPAEPENVLLALAAIDKAPPAPRVLMTDRGQPAELVAYAAAPEPEAQRALEMIIGRDLAARNNAPVALLPAVVTAPARTTAMPGTDTAPVPNAFGGMLDLSFSAITDAGVTEGMTSAVQKLAAAHPLNAIPRRQVELTAPDFEHIAETMAQPVLITSSAYADFYQPDEASSSLATELGPMTNRLGLIPDIAPLPVYDRFVTVAPLLIAAN